MKKLLLGAVMSALFVMDADAGIFSSIKSVATKVKNKTVDIVKGKKVLEDKDIQDIKSIAATLSERAKIFSSYASSPNFTKEERTKFSNISKMVNNLSKFIKTAGRNKVISQKTNDAVDKTVTILSDNINSVNVTDVNMLNPFFSEINNSFNKVTQISMSYPDNNVLQKFLDATEKTSNILENKLNEAAQSGLLRRAQSEIDFEFPENAEMNGVKRSYSTSDLGVSQPVKEFEFEDKATRLEAEADDARRRAAEQRQAEADQQSMEDYNFRLQEAARLEAEAEARRQAEEEARLRAEEEARLRAEEEARLQAEAQAAEAARQQTSSSTRRASVSRAGGRRG